MRTETLGKIQAVFESLDMKISPVEFYNQCKDIGFNPSVALDAIKEFALRLQLTGEGISKSWNEFMAGTEQTIQILTKWEALDEKTILDFLEKDLLWLVGRNVLEDDDPLHLIKIRVF